MKHNNNPIERYNGKIKDRIKNIRSGFKGFEDARNFMNLRRVINNFVNPPKDYGGKCRHNNFKRERKTRNFESNKPFYRRRVIVESVFSSLKRKQQLKLRSKLSYMKKREMGWHVLFYNIRRNLEFDGKSIKENLTFYFFKIEIWITPDKAGRGENLRYTSFLCTL